MQYVFKVSIHDILSAESQNINITNNQNLFYVKIMTSCWDLETYTTIENGEVSETIY